MAVGYRDYYEVLGVPRTATQNEIRTAYRKLARTNHPDINKDPAAEDRFKEVAEAYEVLRDEDKRAQYDRLGANWRAGQDMSGAAGFGAEEGGYYSGGGSPFGDEGDFSDFFSSLFGGRARGGPGGPGGFSMPQKGGNHEATLDISLREASAGGSNHIAFADGREYDVTIPVGVKDGQRIRLSGEGSPGIDGGPSGDLILTVRIAKDRQFRREGDDLHVDVPISPSEAALGSRIPVPTLTGNARVNLPAGSSSGRTLRLKGEGIGGKGNLYAHVQIMVPKTLDDAQRELYEKLAATGFDPRTTGR